MTNFYSYELNNRRLDVVAYNSVVKKQINAFYDTCEANYYYLLYSSGDIEFTDFKDRYIESVDNERRDQKLVLEEIIDCLYASRVYGNNDNQIYNGLKSKISNVKTQKDATEIMVYFEKYFRE